MRSIPIFLLLVIPMITLPAGSSAQPPSDANVMSVSLQEFERYPDYQHIISDLDYQINDKFQIPDGFSPTYAYWWEISDKDEKLDHVTNNQVDYFIEPNLKLVAGRLRIYLRMKDARLNIITPPFRPFEDFSLSGEDFEKYQKWSKRVLANYKNYIEHNKFLSDLIIVKLECNDTTDRLDPNRIEQYTILIPRNIKDYLESHDHDLKDDFIFAYQDQYDSNLNMIYGHFEVESEKDLKVTVSAILNNQPYDLTPKKFDVKKWSESTDKLARHIIIQINAKVE